MPQKITLVMRRYWKENPKRYKEHKERMRLYQEKRRKAGFTNAEFQRTHPTYYSDYMKKKRKKAKRQHLCITCFKRKSWDGTVHCKICLAKSRRKEMMHKKSKQKHNEEAKHGRISH